MSGRRSTRRGAGGDFAALLPDVARRLLGDPPRIGADEWRYGSHGSMIVHPARGTWHDFEAATGGGVLDLVQHVNGCDKAGALRYLVDARLIAAPAGADARPAAPYRVIADRVGGARTARRCPVKPWQTVPQCGPRAGIAGRIGAEAACERSATPCRCPKVPPESARRADGAGAAPTAAVARVWSCGWKGPPVEPCFAAESIYRIAFR